MRGALPLIAAIFGLFLGAAGVGGALAAMFAPESFFAQCVSFFALPVAFAIGLQAWYGFAIIGAVLRLIVLRSRAVSKPSPVTPSIPGGFVFLPISSTMGALAGVLVGMVSPQPLLFVASIYWITGTIHGLLAWRLARAGVLVPPESI